MFVEGAVRQFLIARTDLAQISMAGTNQVQRFERHGLELFLERVLPRHALHFLHRVEEHLVGAATNIVNRHDVRVSQVTGDDCFAQELALLFLILGGLRLEHLQRDFAIDVRLTRGVDDTHPAFAQLFQQFIFRLHGLLGMATFVVVLDLPSGHGAFRDDQRIRAFLRLPRLIVGFDRHPGLVAGAEVVAPGVSHRGLLPLRQTTGRHRLHKAVGRA